MKHGKKIIGLILAFAISVSGMTGSLNVYAENVQEYSMNENQAAEGTRISGKDRYETSIEVAEELREVLGIEKFSSAIIATGKDYADALSGSYLANMKKAPILLTNGKAANLSNLCLYISQNVSSDGLVYILGGQNAVSDLVEQTIKEFGYKVERIGEKTRYETSAAILMKAGLKNNGELLVATGKNFADCLSASATGKPILLVNPDKALTEEQKEIFDNFKTGSIYIVGGENAINSKKMKEIKAYVGNACEIERISGTNRYETSEKIAEKFFENPTQVAIASGKSFPDGLCGGVLASTLNIPMILTKSGNETALNYVKKNNIKTGYVLGGIEAVENETVNAIFGTATIKVAAVETAYGSEMWQKVADAFTVQTGINVELTTDWNIERVIEKSINKGEYPDVVQLSTGRSAGLTEKFIKGNMLTDLTDVLSMKVPGEKVLVSDKIAGGFTESSLTNPYNDGKTYLAPMFYSSCGLFYNATLLKENGWTVPTTWDEMWELGDAALEQGIYLFTYPTTGYVDAFFYALMYSAGGPEFFNKATKYETGIWETEEAQKCFEIVAKLATYTNPITPAQANDHDFVFNQQLVLDNKAIFMPNGTWIVGEMADAPRADGFEWGMTALPAVEEGGAGYSYAWIEQAWIPSGAANVDAAKQFVAFLYSDIACEIFAEEGAVQPVLGIADSLWGDDQMFYSIYDNGAKAAMGHFAAFNAVAGLGTVREVFFDPLNDLVAGKLTKKQWVDNIISSSILMRINII